jgi:hypothetical protein
MKSSLFKPTPINFVDDYVQEEIVDEKNDL